jgi:hypothetical protein
MTTGRESVSGVLPEDDGTEDVMLKLAAGWLKNGFLEAAHGY